MRYAGLIENDFVNGEGVSTTLFLQGCPHRCPGCHNPETWDFEGGIEIDEDELINKIRCALEKNGILRNLSISGGEPLCAQNLNFTARLLQTIKQEYPTIKICLWTGYEFHQLNTNSQQTAIFEYIDTLITGPFILAQRDITLPLRGSSNQQIWRKNNNGILTLQKN